MDEALTERWARVEHDLRFAVNSLGTAISREDREQIAEFLDHNELGVALDWLVDALKETKGPLDADVVSALERAATEMELEPPRFSS